MEHALCGSNESSDGGNDEKGEISGLKWMIYGDSDYSVCIWFNVVCSLPWNNMPKKRSQAVYS